MKARSFYWLAPNPSATQKNLLSLLTSRGFNGNFCPSYEILSQHYNKKRVPIIIISDEGLLANIMDALRSIVTKPNFYGVRLVVTISSATSEVGKKAYSYGVRDIIPIDLDAKSWLARFIFSISNMGQLHEASLPALGVKSITGLYVPARIVWLSATQLRLETKAHLPIGCQVTLTGPLVEQWGAKSVQITVNARDVSNLLYRFSEAYVCQHNFSEKNPETTERILQHFSRKARDFARIRVFIAAASQGMRDALYEQLKKQKYVIATALSMNHIIQEPAYLNPHVIFIDAQLVKQEQPELFINLISALMPSNIHCSIVIVGERANVEDLRKLAGQHPVYLQNKLSPVHFEDLMEEKYLKNLKYAAPFEPPGAQLLKDDDALSFAELYFSARMSSLSLHGARFSMKNIGPKKYSFCRLEAPYLGLKDGNPQGNSFEIYAKVTYAKGAAFEAKTAPMEIEVVFSNLLADKRKLLGQRMLDILKEQLDPKVALAKKTIGASKTDALNIIDIVIPNLPKEPRNKTKTNKATKAFEPSWSDTFNEIKGTAKVLMPFFAVFLLVALLLGGVLGLIEEYAPHYEKSGGNFSRELEKFRKN